MARLVRSPTCIERGLVERFSERKKKERFRLARLVRSPTCSCIERGLVERFSEREV